MTLPSVDWHRIRPHDGSQFGGFEELCCQLAEDERPSNARFERKGTPDAGVECFARLQSGDEWGWQAKYFTSLGEVQWRQIDKSVRRALTMHPRLVRYYVCVPRDLPDPRQTNRRSARQKWDRLTVAWNAAAKRRGMSVEFVFWGSYELTRRLTRPENAGKLIYWFDRTAFDADWFAGRLALSISAAGPRYTPQLHVALPIAKVFDTVGRTRPFFDSLRAHALEIRSNVRRLDDMPAVAVGTSPDKREIEANRVIQPETRVVQEAVGDVLSHLGRLSEAPAGDLHLADVSRSVDTALHALEALRTALRSAESENAARLAGSSGEGRGRSSTEQSNRLAYALRLGQRLQGLEAALTEARAITTAPLLVLSGPAGSGKTHLLCDVAKNRLDDGKPTLLLMGQQFLNLDPPWSQALQQLDLAGLSVEHFVGALESAARAADCRALLLVDAINEGTGRTIWPPHLAAFLAVANASDWISVVVAVRESYTEAVIPQEVLASAHCVFHGGFAGHEYDAMKVFLRHFNIELPSTPLLQPEFRNPLFLKVLCTGLRDAGSRRLPRGFQGISATFNLFMDNVNRTLARRLSFDSRNRLVHRAVDAVVDALASSPTRSVNRERAQQLVDVLLPARTYEASLYYALVSEGVLIEEFAWGSSATADEVVMIAYDRFADHLIATRLLASIDQSNALAAFAGEGPLAHLNATDGFIASGLLEALCIQLPERAGYEFAELAPQIVHHYSYSSAFRGSLRWRSASAFSAATFDQIGKTISTKVDLDDWIDVLVTLTSIPQHPLNANYLDQRLRRDAMAERDAWWSLCLHREWRTERSVDRLVDWAWAVSPDDVIDDAVAGLCATTLAWFLTSSNRYLRDRATKALVALLTGRVSIVTDLVTRFLVVDDPYVQERVLAVAYGVATRTTSMKEVGGLAQVVFDGVFKNKKPPAHILLRDYARGIVCWALQLGCSGDFTADAVTPPYHSIFPRVPTEEEVEPLKARLEGTFDAGDLGWARNRIVSSVLSDDFARYVIGTNSHTSNWLSITLEEQRWQSPEERLNAIVLGLDKSRAEAVALVRQIDSAIARTSSLERLTLAAEGQTDTKPNTRAKKDVGLKLKRLAALRTELWVVLCASLDSATADGLRVALAAIAVWPIDRPYLDLAMVQRYVLWRVFDLGWTVDRFGEFDRFEIGFGGRDAAKAERVGKKYQWIAYHEFMAYVADRFQYREWDDRPGFGNAYLGPWQENLRDIDPTCTIRGDSAEPRVMRPTRDWWMPASVATGPKVGEAERWVTKADDLPRLETLLAVRNPRSRSDWLNLSAEWSWRDSPPADQDPYGADRGDIWLRADAYLVKSKDLRTFMRWAAGVDFMGRWMPEPHDNTGVFLGEHGWAPSSSYFAQPYFGDSGWVKPDRCPVSIRVATFRYLKESSGFDCSVDSGYTLALPCSDLLSLLACRWNGRNAEFADSTGSVIMFDPCAESGGSSALLARSSSLKRVLLRSGLALCWAVLGEKRVLPAGFASRRWPARLSLTGAYALTDDGPAGFLKCFLVESAKTKSGVRRRELKTIRTTARLSR